MTVAAQKKLGMIVFLFTVLAGLFVYSVVGPALRVPPKAAPAFDLAVLEPGSTSSPITQDGRVTLAELRGSPVVLNVWASWCEPCREETPLLVEASGRTDGIVFLGVNTKDSGDAARDFLRESEVTYPVVSDVKEATADRYGARLIPTTYFINARGEIVDEFTGGLTSERLEEGLRLLQQ